MIDDSKVGAVPFISTALLVLLFYVSQSMVSYIDPRYVVYILVVSNFPDVHKQVFIVYGEPAAADLWPDCLGHYYCRRVQPPELKCFFIEIIEMYFDVLIDLIIWAVVCDQQIL